MSLDVKLICEFQVEKECQHCGSRYTEEKEVLFSANITHNLTTMAKAANIYMHIWRPDEIGIKRASQLIDPIEKALEDMKARPEFFKKFDAHNRWGIYEDFIPWIEEYLKACKMFPNSKVEVSR